MNAVDASERLIELVRGNDDIANHADGCDAGTMAAAESHLGAAFPPSYRRLIEGFGTWDIAGEEFLGVYQTPAMGQKLLGSVTETLDAHIRYGMPSDLIVAMFDGLGGLVVLDSSRVNQEGEYPVLVWHPGVADRESMERLGDDFGSFAFALRKRGASPGIPGETPAVLEGNADGKGTSRNFVRFNEGLKRKLEQQAG